MTDINKKRVKVGCPFVQAAGGLVIGVGVLLGAVGKVRDERLQFGLGVGLIIGGLIFVLFLDGCCAAEDEGLVIEMPFRPKRVIPYDEIEWVSLDVKSGGRRSKFGRDISLIHIIKIFTRGETLVFKQHHGWADSREALMDPQKKDFLMLGSPFAEIEKIIKKNKGMDTTPDFLKPYITDKRVGRLR